MLPVRGSRVVTVSSMGHSIRAAIHFDDLQWEHRYDRIAAYGQSKLANLLFTAELQLRLDAAGSSVKAMAAHPGYAATNLQFHSGSRSAAGVLRASSVLDTPGGAASSAVVPWAASRRCSSYVNIRLASLD